MCKAVFIKKDSQKTVAEEEFRRLQRIDHPYIVRYLDLGIESTSLPNMAKFYMEECKIGNLYEFIRSEVSRINASRGASGPLSTFTTTTALLSDSTVGGTGLLESNIGSWLNKWRPLYFIVIMVSSM